MFNVGIIIPIYFNEEDLATLLMKLTQLNYDNINPTLYLAVIDIRESFFHTFIEDYKKRYDKNLNSCNAYIFDGIYINKNDSIFNPSYLMNEIIDEFKDNIDLICVIDPQVGIKSNNVIYDLVNVYKKYGDENQCGVICTDNTKHNLNMSQIIRLNIDDYSVISSVDGNGFSNGCMITSKIIWEKMGKFISTDYTTDFSQRCFRNNHPVLYIEGVQ